MEANIKIHCNRCNQATNHNLKAEHIVSDNIKFESEPDVMETHCAGTYKYQIFACMGCDSITFRQLDIFDNYIDIDENGQIQLQKYKEFETYYPERVNDLLSISKIAGVPKILNRLYQEIIECYNYDLRIMCSAGLRSIVEGICNHYKLSGKTLANRIDTLKNNGILSQKTCSSLHAHRFLGNYAIHQQEIPDKNELKSAIEIIEHTLIELFELPIKDSNLRVMIINRIKES